MENVISWNLGPLHLSAALPYIAQTIQKRAAVVLLQEVLIRARENGRNVTSLWGIAFVASDMGWL